MAKKFLDYEGLTDLVSNVKKWVDAHIGGVGQRGMVQPDGSSIGVLSDGTIFVQNVDVQAFLSSYPVGAYYASDSARNPREVYGGTWEQQPSIGAYLWRRMPPSSTLDASVFLQAHPIGSSITMDDNPGTVGGSWTQAPSLGARKWIRKV